MPRKPQLERLGACGLIVPSHEIQNFLAIGWCLGDEPGCGTARMFPVIVDCGVHRVPNNPEIALLGKKTARPRWRREPGKKTFEHGLDKRKTESMQAR